MRTETHEEKKLPTPENLIAQIKLAMQKKDIQRAEELFLTMTTLNHTAAAEACLTIVERHQALSDSEKDLLDSIKNQIRVKFNLPGAIPPIVDFEMNSTAPDKWFW